MAEAEDEVLPEQSLGGTAKGRGKAITTYVTPTEYTRIRMAAIRLGVPMQTYIAVALLEFGRRPAEEVRGALSQFKPRR